MVLIYGIELLNAKEQLRGDNDGHFVIVNEAAVKTEDIALDLDLSQRSCPRDRRRQGAHLRRVRSSLPHGLVVARAETLRHLMSLKPSPITLGKTISPRHTQKQRQSV